MDLLTNFQDDDSPGMKQRTDDAKDATNVFRQQFDERLQRFAESGDRYLRDMRGAVSPTMDGAREDLANANAAAAHAAQTALATYTTDFHWKEADWQERARHANQELVTVQQGVSH